MLNSLERLSALSIAVYFKDKQNGIEGASFFHPFTVEYFEPDTPGTSGTISFNFNRFFIPRARGYIWHPAQLCRALKLETSKLIFWAIAPYTYGWKGTARDLYELVNRFDFFDGEDTQDAELKQKRQANYRRWKADRLKPALDELTKHEFRVKQEKTHMTKKNLPYIGQRQKKHWHTVERSSTLKLRRTRGKIL